MSPVRPETGTVAALIRPSVWSNLFFLLPFMLSVEFGNIILSLLIALLFASSTIYHFDSEGSASFYLNTDRIFSGLLMLFTAGLVAFGGFTPPYFYWVLICTAISLYFLRRQREAWSAGRLREYELYHTAWHFFSALISLFSILTFYL